MWHLLPPSALLLLVSSVTQAANHSKAVVFLDPPWVRMLEDDNVTLTCQGDYPPEDNSTHWYHNGTRISSQASSYFIRAVRIKDSGEYQCQTGLSTRSDTVQLQVHADWLVLQTTKWVFQEGELIRLRCHTWKNKPLYKVTYVQNGRPQRFFHRNLEFHIPEATLNHSGSYYCRGLLGYNNMSSRTVDIIVGDPTFPSIDPPFASWHQITLCLVMGLLFALDTGLYISIQRDFQRSMVDKEEHNFKWNRNQDK
ncbi:PREDICTED: low affinity immunoglobulin gamma Fc region receptor III-B-like isoform X2 [Chinchilla lanigera]|uniref:Low affinity immunoglobulin gamma Fc region receptor III-B-like n=1 Tax=Chinchilla lanigera TaxID=34839 RepID=A0A8C2V8U6_CHILA|nr:PREDICTED: low affinity immunoglobulin gamma Fc region receptor III-B-like isoform X2 [Chinchilla lanigera]